MENEPNKTEAFGEKAVTTIENIDPGTVSGKEVSVQRQNPRTKKLIQAALIAAVYCALTILLAPISYGPVQFRVSEALTVLPAITPMGAPGIIIGCALANLMSPYGMLDVVLGTLATALAAVLTYALRKFDFLAPLPPVIANGVIIGCMLHFAYGVPGLWGCMGWVALGELVVCYGIGLPLLKLLKKYERIFE